MACSEIDDLFRTGWFTLSFYRRESRLRSNFKKRLKNMESKKRPSFIHIAPGAKVKGLIMDNNTMVGKGNFLDNEGELEDSTLDNNKHIIPSSSQESIPIRSTIKKIVVGVVIGVLVLVLGYLIFDWLGFDW